MGWDHSLIEHDDGLNRCGWAGLEPIYANYHDEEWGVPEYDDRALWEKLILDGFQAGLSWITILKKRDSFREAFDDFNPEIIARYDEAKQAELMQNAGIVRNRAKIAATIGNAQVWLDIMESGPGFTNYLWDYCDGKPIQNQFKELSEVPAETGLSKIISKDLKKRGFRFCGPTIVYAFMQAVGMVNDHLLDCHRREPVAAIPPRPGFG
ncbi:MAG: DNA-3-methyladenine glycosylase I [Rhizobiales bacterium]|nr:DNA-3-methyladenine glycosylase I [Hyphomicrobiales bacterium]